MEKRKYYLNLVERMLLGVVVFFFPGLIIRSTTDEREVLFFYFMGFGGLETSWKWRNHMV